MNIIQLSEKLPQSLLPCGLDTIFDSLIICPRELFVLVFLLLIVIIVVCS